MQVFNKGGTSVNTYHVDAFTAKAFRGNSDTVIRFYTASGLLKPRFSYNSVVVL